MKNTYKEKEEKQNIYKHKTIRINENEWDLFRELAKANESDASKEIRKFIKEYIAEHSHQIKDIVMKGQKND